MILPVVLEGLAGAVLTGILLPEAIVQPASANTEATRPAASALGELAWPDT